MLTNLLRAITLAAVCALLPAQSIAELSASFQALSKRVNASVVKVVATGYRELEDDQTDEPGVAAKQQSSGAGVVFSAEGLIVTNAHVVKGAQRVQVTLPQQRGRAHRAEIVGLDFETDIALLRIPVKNLVALPFADSDAVEQGQIVLAFGSPLGLDNSVSMGVISSALRQLKSDDTMAYLQTDAPINPGSSGGPLVNAEGQVVGLNTLILSQSGGSEGLGFAVPGNVVRSVVEQLLAKGRVVRGDVGLAVQTITPLLAAGWKLARDSGVLVSDVDEGSTAGKAGLQEGDILLTLNGKPVENARQFNILLYRPAIGSKVAIEVLRGEKRLSFQVGVVEKPDPEALRALGSRVENLVGEFGVFGLDLTPEVLEQNPELRGDKGVLVVALHADGPILEEPFKVGDAIYAVNREAVTSLAGLRAVLRKMKTGDAAAVQVERHGRLRFLSFEMP